MKLTRRGMAAAAVSALAGALLLTACGSDDKLEPRAYEITALDYAFRGVPEKVAVGSSFTLVNDSSEELHELVALRIADSEKRAVKDLIELSDEELEGVIEEMPAMVLIAMPDEEGMAVVGDGTFSQPGRYALVCFVPTGADPQAFMEAEGDGPPQIDGGPAHAFQGMIGQVIVE